MKEYKLIRKNAKKEQKVENKRNKFMVGLYGCMLLKYETSLCEKITAFKTRLKIHLRILAQIPLISPPL
jgi:hypothetical protein